jgi:hypothetical protein
MSTLLNNDREAILARLGQWPADQGHPYEIEAPIDTGAI